MSDKTKKLEEFVAWVGGHIKGDEKGEAQIYLNYLFQTTFVFQRLSSRQIYGIVYGIHHQCRCCEQFLKNSRRI